MSTPEHERLETLFHAALARSTPGERAAFLDEACRDDAALRGRVDALLAAHGRIGSFLETPPVDAEETFAVGEPGEIVGTRVGRYKILQEIGEGGFGVVYVAEQEEPVRRTVALKIIKIGMDTKQVIARFEAERQALALMDHPNIARVLDAGATFSGRPYFVMELVKGIKITRYCDEHGLSTRERINLFIPVCHAVQHAHQKGIIHRDLKPGNVLVTLEDGKPVPKVIDFGIAKATGQRLTEHTLFTEFRQFLGTPEYMSPDQTDVSGLDIDTRSDIYSLGVLLYEVLTGTTPFDPQQLRQAPLDEIKRVIREVDPPRPSVRARALAGSTAARPRIRAGDPAPLPRLLRGDLDWIVMKALEKDRTRRYDTARGLADDLERHLRYQPVEAGPPATLYRLGKFVRRNRTGVLAAGLIAAALVAGLSLAMIGLVQATRAQDALRVQRDAARLAEDRARAQRARAEASAAEAQRHAARSATVSEFLQGMLRAVDPSKALGRELSVRYVLDEAADRIRLGELDGQPEVESTVRLTLGETYQALGLYPAAEEHLRAAQTIRARRLGDEHPDTLRANRALAGLLRVVGKFTEAEALLRRTVAMQERVLGPEALDTLVTLDELALALWGPQRYAEAEALHRRTLEVQRRVLGEEHIRTIQSLGHLGVVCRALGRRAEAERLLRQAHELTRRNLGTGHPVTADAMSNLALLLEDQGEDAQAETLYGEAYEADCRVFGLDHPRTQIQLNSLLRVLRRQGKTDAIQPLVAARLARLERAAERSGADAPTLRACAWELLHCEVAELRDAAKALPIAVRLVELEGGRDVEALETLALACRAAGDLERAIATQRQAVAVAKASASEHLAALEAQLIEYFVQAGDVAGATSLWWEGLGDQLRASVLPDRTPGAPLLARSEQLMAQGRCEEAADTLRACLATRQKALSEGHWLIADAMSRLGAALAGQGKFADGESLLLSSFEQLQSNRQAWAEPKRQAVQRIIELYEAWDRPDQADAWRLRLREFTPQPAVTLPADGAASSPTGGVGGPGEGAAPDPGTESPIRLPADPVENRDF